MDSTFSVVLAAYLSVTFLIWITLVFDSALKGHRTILEWEQVAVAILWPVIVTVKIGRAIYDVLWEICK